MYGFAGRENAQFLLLSAAAVAGADRSSEHANDHVDGLRVGDGQALLGDEAAAERRPGQHAHCLRLRPRQGDGAPPLHPPLPTPVIPFRLAQISMHRRFFCSSRLQVYLYTAAQAGPASAQFRKAAGQGAGFGLGQGIFFLLYALAFWYGSRLVDAGEIDAGAGALGIRGQTGRCAGVTALPNAVVASP